MKLVGCGKRARNQEMIEDEQEQQSRPVLIQEAKARIPQILDVINKQAPAVSAVYIKRARR